MSFAARHAVVWRPNATPTLCAFLLAAVLLPTGASAQPSPKPFEIVPGSFQVKPATLQAGVHADLTIGFDFAHSAAGRTFNDVRTTVVELPAGFAGAATTVPTCTQEQFLSGLPGPECPPDTQVGTMSLSFTLGSTSAQATLPLYNIALTGPGLPAELGFRAFTDAQLMPLTIRPRDGGLNVTTPNIETTGEPRDISVTIWGVPAATSHDAERGRNCLPASLESSEVSCSGGGESAGDPPRPFLANPTECGAPLPARIEAYSWEEPESPSTASAGVGPFTECERVPFAAEIEASPTSDAAESPTGFDLSLSLSQGQGWTEPESRTTSALASVSVKLPEGLALNPAGAGGMLACMPVQLGRETAASRSPEGCPEGSKLGTAAIETPLLGEPLTGSAYLGAPSIGPEGGLAAGLYVVARAPAAGVLVELRGRLQADPSSGRLSAVFGEVPQMPFSRLELRFRSGQLAPLSNPPVCGSYAAAVELTPTSEPGAPRPAADSFAITHGADGGPCSPPGSAPFGPGLIAGTLNPSAGRYSPFDFRLSRRDGEARLGGFTATLPPGVSARVAGIPLCPKAAIEAARAQSGAEAQASPTCPADSRVGSVAAALGAGASPFYAQGAVYVAGPYEGAPLSLAIVVPALAGPFDLGTAVTRAALGVDPETAQLSVRSGPLPALLDGVPLDLRDLRIHLDHPGFVRNPTSCEPTRVEGTASGAPLGGEEGGEGASAPAALPTAALSARFQAADCRALRFKPRLSLRLIGALGRNGHPGLRAVLRPRAGDADLADASFALPPTELLDPDHIRAVCAAPELAAGRCPRDSVVGHAVARSPLLDAPLEGPIFLRASAHRFPDFTADLRGQIHVLLGGRAVFAGGRLGVRFPALPDIPLSRVAIALAGGRRGLIVNSEPLCAAPARAAVALTAHNGRVDDFKPILRCAKLPSGSGYGFIAPRSRREASRE